MVKNHIKRLTIPNTWKGIAKKENKFIIKPAPGPHAKEMSMPLALLLKRIGIAKTTKECVFILHNTEVLVDGRRIQDTHFPVGFLDVLTIKANNESYRLVLDKNGVLDLVKLENHTNANTKTCKVHAKRVIANGKIQLNLSDGRNVLVEKTEYKVGDSVVLELPSQNVSKHLKLVPGAKIVLIGGKHGGDHGEVVHVESQALSYKNVDGKEIKTLRAYAYVVDGALA